MPRLAMLTALAYALGAATVPLPGGTSGHALGVALLALVFGLRLGLPRLQRRAAAAVAALRSWRHHRAGRQCAGHGPGGAAAAISAKKLFGRLGDTFAVAVAAWLSVVLPGAVVVVVLGIQPLIAHQPDGTPLFFPFGPPSPFLPFCCLMP